jgi:DNA-binding beta-propeller fold protein YncE
VIRPGSNEAEWIRLDSLASWGVLDVAVGMGSVWALTWRGTLVRIDPETRRVRTRIPIGLDTEPLAVAVGAGSVWVTNRGDLSVSEIDPRRNRVVRTIPLGEVGAFPCGIAATHDAVWVTIGPDTDCASPQTR